MYLHGMADFSVQSYTDGQAEDGRPFMGSILGIGKCLSHLFIQQMFLELLSNVSTGVNKRGGHILGARQ